MNIVLWVLAGALAAAFLGAGVMKVSQPREKLVEKGMGFAADFPMGLVRTIGALEILAAIGLILPAVTGIAPIFVPLAALGLVAMMIGAAIVHFQRKEYPAILPNLVLLAMAAVVTWGRFGPYAF
ncbi:DoxX-like protein [Micromonospora sp. Llam0]|uniref:DoxX family protein n=1 Tax=Micromonospora sp. Llam0 TaxID=2485143 RepID=UPI000F49F8B4|nr:DoxX family protein [Micromonospora sp. Llam0]ROO52134.1 DoxX-like protein [Micromonospora sp. Llam0]